MRRLCDEIWVLDLGGEGRGTRKGENVFAIQTPVAIAIGIRVAGKTDTAAVVHFARIEGTSEEKLGALDRIRGTASVHWRDCPRNWHDPFRPSGEGRYFEWPLLTDLLPWQHSGAQVKRTWPICPDAATLRKRWGELISAQDRATAFHESRDRKISARYAPLSEGNESDVPISQLPADSPSPRIARYAYRSFDRQWILADTRVADYLRPDLWRTWGEKQLCLTSQLWRELGTGPALTASAQIPDYDFFSGRGGKQVIPLYRDSDGSEPNILPGLLKSLGERFSAPVTPEDFLAYVYGVLAQPAFTARFATELENRELRVPITNDSELFEKARSIGARLLWLHTYCERFVPDGDHQGQVPCGAAKCTKAVSSDPACYPEAILYDESKHTLHVGDGEFAPVAPDVYEFDVSGLKVVQSWLKYRLKKGGTRKSSPLDDIRPERWTSQFTTELLQLLWVLEATIAGYPEQERLLESIVTGGCTLAGELPCAPDEMRKPPSSTVQVVSLF